MSNLNERERREAIERTVEQISADFYLYCSDNLEEQPFGLISNWKIARYIDQTSLTDGVIASMKSSRFSSLVLSKHKNDCPVKHKPKGIIVLVLNPVEGTHTIKPGVNSTLDTLETRFMFTRDMKSMV